MDKTSAENLVSQAFNYPFNQSKYSELISNIFKVSVKSELNVIPISEKFKDIVSNIKNYSNYSDTKSKKKTLEIEPTTMFHSVNQDIFREILQQIT